MLNTEFVKITSGESLSNAFTLDKRENSTSGLRLFGLDVPSSWTTANITVYQKHIDGTYKAVKDENGSELTITATAGATIRFSNPAQFSALSDIKLLSGSSSAAVNQTADRYINLILRNI